jgi:DNA-binding response OmpR family regulator
VVTTTDPALGATLARALRGQPCARVIVTDDLRGLASLRAANPEARVVIVALRRTQVGAALDAGADCALAGPIRPAELRARVRALARRAERRLTVGPLILDGAARSVQLDGVPLALPAREFEVLRCLASAPGRVFTKQELQRACWSAIAPPARSRTLERHLARLRRRLGPHRSMLVTVWAVGYRLDPPA